MKGILITTDSEISIKDFSDPLYISLGEEVDGYIEVVHPRGLPFVMVVNDEGLYRDFKFNPIASYFYGTHAHESPILGNVVILKEGYTDDGYDFVPMDDAEIAAYTSLCESIAATLKIKN